jgi:hypothetical protein
MWVFPFPASCTVLQHRPWATGEDPGAKGAPPPPAVVRTGLRGGAPAGDPKEHHGPHKRWVDIETFRRGLREEFVRWEVIQDARRPFSIPVRGCARDPDALRCMVPL